MSDEKWFFIEDIGPTEALKMVKTIPYTGAVIKSPAESEGISFPEKYKDHIFYLYGISPYTIIRRWDTNILNVQMIRQEHNSERFKFSPLSCDQVNMEVIKELDNPTVAKRIPVLDSPDNMEAWQSMVPVISKFINSIDVNASVSNSHGAAFPVMADVDKIFIRFWSSPYIEGGCSYQLKKVCGFTVCDGQKDALRSSGDGIQLIDVDKNCVAQIYGTTIYILFDLPHSPAPFDRTPKILDAILLISAAENFYTV